MTALLASALAVVGTLVGTLLGSRTQLRAARLSQELAQSGADRAERRRQQLDAVVALSEAISAHRRAMVRRGDAYLRHEPADQLRQLRAISHETRGAVTAPLTRLRVLVDAPAVLTAADAMVTATYAMRRGDGTTDQTLTRERLDAARTAAVEAHDEFVRVARDHLKTI